MGADSRGTLGMTENGEMECWSNGQNKSQHSSSPVEERSVADFEYVSCPKCHDKFMAGEEFFRLPQAYCHCPYCGNEFRVGVAAGEATQAADKRASRTTS
jgi:ribosomal protein S27E